MTFFTTGRLSGLAPAYFDAALHTKVGLADRAEIYTVLRSLHRRFIAADEILTINHDRLLFDDIKTRADISDEEKSKRVLERIADKLTPELAVRCDPHAALASAREIAVILGDDRFHELEVHAMAEAHRDGKGGLDTAGMAMRHGTNISLQDGKVAVHKRVEWLRSGAEGSEAGTRVERAVLKSDIVVSFQLERSDSLAAQAVDRIRRIFSNAAGTKNYELKAEVESCCLSTNDSGVAGELDQVRASFWDSVKNLLMNVLGGVGICFHSIKLEAEAELARSRPGAMNLRAPMPDAGAAEPLPAVLLMGPSMAKAKCLRAHRVDGWGQTAQSGGVELSVHGDTVTRLDKRATIDLELCRAWQQRVDQQGAFHEQGGEPVDEIHGRMPPAPPARVSPLVSQEEAVAQARSNYFRHIAGLYGPEAAIAAFEGVDFSSTHPLTPDQIEQIEAMAKSFGGFGRAANLAQLVVVRIWPNHVLRGNYGHAAATIRGPKVLADGPAGQQAWRKTHHSAWPAHAPATPLHRVDPQPSRSYRADKYNEISNHAAAALVGGEFELRPRQKIYGEGDARKAGVSAFKIYLPLFGQNALDDRTAAPRPCLFGLSALRMRGRWADVVRDDFQLWSTKRNCAGSVMTLLDAGGAGVFAKRPKDFRGAVLPTDANKYAVRVATEIDRLNEKANRLIDDVYRTKHNGDMTISLRAAWDNYVANGNTNLRAIFSDADIDSTSPSELMRKAKRVLDTPMLQDRPHALAVLCGLRNRMCELSNEDDRTTLPLAAPRRELALDIRPEPAEPHESPELLQEAVR